VLHHVLLEVAELERSGAFYDALLAPLGWRRHFDDETAIGWGIAKPVFFIASNHPPQAGFGMVSFSASGIAAVKAAWEGGTGAGGTSVGEPGLGRAHGSGPYSAFLRDPDGYDVEVTVGAD
jgi:catechol 2,3-dioxygenase-like lactoylglutathione lyase family enzyme